MNQLFTRLALVAGASIFFCRCTTPPDCFELSGHWTNREGQVLVFQPDGAALWLIRFGSRYDTFPIRYRYDCSQKPVKLDLSDFRSGPLTGKTLFGILEWAGDSVFRFEAEPGSNPEVRPEKFNVEQSERYFKE